MMSLTFGLFTQVSYWRPLGPHVYLVLFSSTRFYCVLFQITVIDNLDDFGIDLEEFSDTVQERFACGASVTLSRDEHKTSTCYRTGE